jgi:hypothetical protein
VLVTQRACLKQSSHLRLYAKHQHLHYQQTMRTSTVDLLQAFETELHVLCCCCSVLVSKAHLVETARLSAPACSTWALHRPCRLI